MSERDKNAPIFLYFRFTTAYSRIFTCYFKFFCLLLYCFNVRIEKDGLQTVRTNITRRDNFVGAFQSFAREK